MAFDPTVLDKEQVNAVAITAVAGHGAVKTGELVLLTSGDHMGLHGGTNQLKLLRV